MCNVVSFVVRMGWWYIQTDRGGSSIRCYECWIIHKQVEVVNWTAIRRFEFCRYYTAPSGLQTVSWVNGRVDIDGTYIAKSGSDIAGANAARADLGIACERCSRDLARDRQGRQGLPLSRAQVREVRWGSVKASRIHSSTPASMMSNHWCVIAAGKHISARGVWPREVITEGWEGGG